MTFQQVGDNRTVAMNDGRVLVASGYAVTANDCAIKDFGRRNQCWQDTFGIHTVNIGIMEKTLCLQHVNINHFG
ncbi:hypothetical protein SDC9_81457 [bioreactor metagenome]|uniref:Uncharacterized protein n=1 Tax=bioreactor metagenome TaxID=1076179 RepID=A0A644Z2P9_9ZZZZ